MFPRNFLFKGTHAFMQKALTSRDRNFSGTGAAVQTLSLSFSYQSASSETPFLVDLGLVC